MSSFYLTCAHVLYREPTALDALAFAYLHTLLNSTDELRIEVARRVNLVTWERRVYEQVRSSFESAGSS